MTGVLVMPMVGLMSGQPMSVARNGAPRLRCQRMAPVSESMP